jgi:hypothetical protein
VTTPTGHGSRFVPPQHHEARAEDRRPPVWFYLGLVAIAALIAYELLWYRVTDPRLFFGGDLVAYTSAADRLVETGTPYHPALFLGPVANRVQNIPIGYFYPPVLAQIFVPLRDIPPTALAVGWASAQAVCLVILLPLVVGLGSRPSLGKALLAIAFGLTFYPLQFAIYGGNVSGWLAIGVALALVAGPGIRGVVSAVATTVKFTPIPMFAAALMDRRSRIAAVAPLVAIVAASFLLAPRAWSDWLTVLPNVLRNEMGSATQNLSPANTMREIGLEPVGIVAGWVLFLGFAVAAIVFGRREGYTRRVVAMAAFAVTFASSTMWDHYLALMAPLILWAWPIAGRARQVAIAVFVAAAASLWFLPYMPAGTHLVLISSLVVCCVAIATLREPTVEIDDGAAPA